MKRIKEILNKKNEKINKKYPDFYQKNWKIIKISDILSYIYLKSRHKTIF